MRRLLPTMRSFIVHSGQWAATVAGWAAVGVMAMAAAPQALVASAAPEVVSPDAAPSPPPVRAVAEPAGDPIRMVRFIRPVANHAINSRFGTRHLAGEAHARAHQGVDIAAPTGTTVRTTAPGVVTAAGYDAGGYGNYVEVRHPNGLRSFYGHLSRIEARVGQAVETGQRFGRVGSTGYSTGPHLHFEIRRGGARLNPVRYLGREFAVKA